MASLPVTVLLPAGAVFLADAASLGLGVGLLSITRSVNSANVIRPARNFFAASLNWCELIMAEMVTQAIVAGN